MTRAGPKLKYDERATPTYTFCLDVEESGKEGQTRHSYIPVEIIGTLSERVAASLDSSMECLVEGRLAYRKAMEKNGQKKAGLVVVSWDVTITTPALSRPVESQI